MENLFPSIRRTSGDSPGLSALPGVVECVGLARLELQESHLALRRYATAATALVVIRERLEQHLYSAPEPALAYLIIQQLLGRYGSRDPALAETIVEAVTVRFSPRLEGDEVNTVVEILESSSGCGAHVRAGAALRRLKELPHLRAESELFDGLDSVIALHRSQPPFSTQECIVKHETHSPVAYALTLASAARARRAEQIRELLDAGRERYPLLARCNATAHAVAALPEKAQKGQLLDAIRSAFLNPAERIQLLCAFAQGAVCGEDRLIASEAFSIADKAAGMLSYRETVLQRCYIAERAFFSGMSGISRAILEPLGDAASPYREFFIDHDAPIIAVARTYARIGQGQVGIALLDLARREVSGATETYGELELAQAYAKAELNDAAGNAIARAAQNWHEGYSDALAALMDLAERRRRAIAEIPRFPENPSAVVATLRSVGEIDGVEALRLLSILGDRESVVLYDDLLGEVSQRHSFMRDLHRWAPPLLSVLEGPFSEEAVGQLTISLTAGVPEIERASDAAAVLLESRKKENYLALTQILCSALSQPSSRVQALLLVPPIIRNALRLESRLARRLIFDLMSSALVEPVDAREARSLAAVITIGGSLQFLAPRQLLANFTRRLFLAPGASPESHSWESLPVVVGKALLALITKRRPEGVHGGSQGDLNERESDWREIANHYFHTGGVERNPGLAPHIATLCRRNGGFVMLRDFARQQFANGVPESASVVRALGPALAESSVKRDRDRFLELLRSQLRERGPNDPIFFLLAHAVPAMESERAQFQVWDDEQLIQPHQEGRERSRIREYEVILSAAAHPDVRGRFTRAYVRELSRCGYLSREVGEWLESGGPSEGLPGRIECLRALTQRGIVPSHAVLEYFSRRGVARGRVQETLAEIEALREEYRHCDTVRELVTALSNNRDGAIRYYVPRAPETRFQLINAYPFERFWEILQIAQHFRVHSGPLDRMRSALIRAGHTDEGTDGVIRNLCDGHHPFYSSATPTLGEIIRIDVSDSARLASADRDIPRIMGARQLGAILRGIVYRSFVSDEKSTQSTEDEFLQATTLETLADALVALEARLPSYRERCRELLKGEWHHLTRRLGIGIALDDLLWGTPQIAATHLFRGTEQLRRARRESKLTVLQALKGENPRMTACQKDISRKMRALREIRDGLERDRSHPVLRQREQEIVVEIARLEDQRERLSQLRVVDRFGHLSRTERARAIESEERYLRAIVAKSPAYLLVSVIAELVDPAWITERDAELLKEVASHLEAPFATVEELVDLGRMSSPTESVKRVGVRLLDKVADLVSFARFADSRLCCYSSTNYEMRVSHRTNKEWLAARLRDPLSFVWMIEEQGSIAGRSVTNNLGFVMGDYGIDAAGDLTLNLNGIYLSVGNDQRSSTNILGVIERQCAIPLGVRYILLQGQHGGAPIEGIPGYVAGTMEVSRLRALCAGEGTLNSNYDDLGVYMNVPTLLHGYIKDLKRTGGLI